MTSRSSGTSSRSRSARSTSTSSVRRSRLLRPIRRASVASAASSSRASWTSTSGSRPRSQRLLDEPRRARFGGCRTASSRTRSAPAARRSGELALLDDELLGQDRHARRRRGRPQVVDRAAEPVRLAQDRDRGRAAGLVGPGPGDDVVARGGDPPADGDARLISAIRWRPGAASRSAIGRGVGGAPTVAPWRTAPARSSRSARRRAAISSTTARARGGRRPSCRRPRLRARARRRSARSARAARSRGPASIVSAARSIPSSSCSTSPATSNAAPALSRTTSRRAPGSPRRTASVDPGVLVGRRRPPARSWRSCAARARAARDLVPLDALRTDVVGTPAAVERQLVDAGAVDHERPLRAEPLGDLGDPRPRSASPTPRSCRRVPAGFVSGPSRLNAVRTPISRRVGPAWRIAGWKFGANRNAKPSVAQRRAGRRRRRGRSGRPAHRARRPSPTATSSPGCRAWRPARRRPRRRAPPSVEMLNVPLPSPPVPTTSIAPSGRLDADDALAHRGREAGQLVDGLAAHPEAHEQRRQLGRRRLAVHDRAHRQRAPRRSTASRPRRSSPGRPGRRRSSTVSVALVRHRPGRPSRTSRSRRRAARPRPRRPGAGSWRAGAGPAGVSTLSGWNWTPSSGSATWRMPMITRSTSLIAVTRSSGGSVAGSTASEW